MDLRNYEKRLVMAKEKDPAFLLYSKDWIEGTAELMPSEKGIYIDLLAYQHQKKGLPKETERLARLVGLSHSDFLKLWERVKEKFILIEGKLFNQRLLNEMDKRSIKASKNTIVGTFAAVLRLSKLTPAEYKYAKSEFISERFTDIPTSELTERLHGWLTECLKSIGTENSLNNINKDSTNLDYTGSFETVAKHTFEDAGFIEGCALHFRTDERMFKEFAKRKVSAMNLAGELSKYTISSIRRFILKDFEEQQQKMKNTLGAKEGEGIYKAKWAK